MIDDILRNNLIIREWLNGGLLPLNLSLVLVIGLFLWDSYRAPHKGAFGDVAGVKTACALMWIFFFDGLRAGLVWALLYSAPHVAPVSLPGVTTSMVLVNAGFILAGVGGLAATLRCIFLFSPPPWRHAHWIISAAGTVAWQIITHAVRP